MNEIAKNRRTPRVHSQFGSYPGTDVPASRDVVMMASTIGPMEAGSRRSSRRTERGQRLIEGFGKDRYGAPLFFPESRAWVAAQAR